MASSPVSALDAVAREIAALPDGSTWIRGAMLKRLVAALLRDRVRGGANVDEVPTHRGRFFNAQAGGGTASTPGAFDLSVAVTNGAAAGTFNPGTGQNLAPTNVLQTVPVPAGTMSYAFLRLYTDGQSVQSCELRIETTAPASPTPVKGALPMQVDALLHLIGYTAPTGGASTGTYTPYRVFYPATDVQLTPILAFQTSVDDPQPGGAPYDNWYTWQIGGT